MSTVPSEPKSPALRQLYWRDEILQVMFWIEGEGLGDEVDVRTVSRFLGVEGDVVVRYLDRLVTEGLLEAAASDRYRLSAQGRADGGRIFAEEFSELTQPGHGECGADCWCHASPEEAEACHDDRVRAGGPA
jgi:hypothetical protein